MEAVSHETRDETAPLRRLADGLLELANAMAEESVAGFQETFPSYARVERSALTPIVLANTRNLLTAIRDREPDQLVDRSSYRDSGEQRARMGITTEEMLHAWRIGLKVVREHAYRLAHEVGIGDDVVLKFVEELLHHGDIGMLESASTHRETELELARHEQHHRANLVRGILFGTLSPAATRVQAATYGLETDRRYVAVRARPTRDISVSALERHLGVADGAGPRRGLAALLDGDLAGFVRAPIRDPIPIAVGVGPPAGLDGLENSFRLASRALETAVASGLSGPVSVDALGLVPAVIADGDVGDELCRRVLDPVLAQGRSGRTLVETLARYLENDLRLELTAEQMFLHVNTVRYRLRRFEELTGMSLRHVDDLVQIWWALRRHKLGRSQA